MISSAFQPSSAWAGGELVDALKNREIFLKAKDKMDKRSEWLALIKEFEAAGMAQYNTRHASRARYLGAELAIGSAEKFGQKADYDTAGALAKRAVRDCPYCPHSPDAQLIFGRALMAQEQLDLATKELMKVELNYPGSPEVTPARQLLASLKGGPPPVPETDNSPKAVPEQATPIESAQKDQPESKQMPASTDDGAAKKTASPGQPKKGLAAAPDSADGGTERANPKAQQATAASKIKTPTAPPPRADGRGQVYGLALSDEGAYVTVSVFVDKITPYVYNLVPPSRADGSFRVYADLKGAVVAPKTKTQIPSGNALIKLLKMNQFNSDVVRIVMDMPEAHHYRPTFLDNPPRLVFQVSREASGLPAQVAEAQPEAPESKSASVAVKGVAPKAAPAKGPKESLARQLGLKIKTVVIDPGHGGKDLGTSNKDLKEKEIVLALSKKLAAKIEKQMGLTVHLTRDKDHFITLERRTKIAKEGKADLFISLHVNANKLAEVEGFETYILNIATDNSAMEVAARENAESNKSMSELKDILHIIGRNTKIAESRAMAQTIHKSALSTINKKYKVRDLGVKEAPFHVLLGTEVPAILVEIGFLTNEKDASLLAQDAYLDAVAEGLAKGLENYVEGF